MRWRCDGAAVESARTAADLRAAMMRRGPLTAAVYFCIVLPMNKFKERMKKSEPEASAEPTDVELLTEIRDLLAAQKQR